MELTGQGHVAMTVFREDIAVVDLAIDVTVRSYRDSLQIWGLSFAGRRLKRTSTPPFSGTRRAASSYAFCKQNSVSWDVSNEI